MRRVSFELTFVPKRRLLLLPDAAGRAWKAKCLFFFPRLAAQWRTQAKRDRICNALNTKRGTTLRADTACRDSWGPTHGTDWSGSRIGKFFDYLQKKMKTTWQLGNVVTHLWRDEGGQEAFQPWTPG